MGRKIVADFKFQYQSLSADTAVSSSKKKNAYMTFYTRKYQM